MHYISWSIFDLSKHTQVETKTVTNQARLPCLEPAIVHSASRTPPYRLLHRGGSNSLGIDAPVLVGLVGRVGVEGPVSVQRLQRDACFGVGMVVPILVRRVVCILRGPVAVGRHVRLLLDLDVVVAGKGWDAAPEGGILSALPGPFGVPGQRLGLEGIGARDDGLANGARRASVGSVEAAARTGGVPRADDEHDGHYEGEQRRVEAEAQGDLAHLGGQAGGTKVAVECRVELARHDQPGDGGGEVDNRSNHAKAGRDHVGDMAIGEFQEGGKQQENRTCDVADGDELADVGERRLGIEEVLGRRLERRAVQQALEGRVKGESQVRRRALGGAVGEATAGRHEVDGVRVCQAEGPGSHVGPNKIRSRYCAEIS